MEELKIEVFGRVQGIGFRQFVKSKALELGVKGHVKNNEDGSVSIVAQGLRDNLEDFLVGIQKEHLLSNIEKLDYKWQRLNKEFDSFLVIPNGNLIRDKRASFMQLGKSLLTTKNKPIVPQHTAIILDGNRRWARERGLKDIDGYRKSGSYENVIRLFKEAQRLKIKYLSVWAFSTENWNRDRKEINFLFSMIYDSVKRFRNEFIENNIRFIHIGRTDRLPKKLVIELKKLEKETEQFSGLNIQACLDYGGRDEIVRAVNKMLKDGVKEVKEEDIKKYLDTADIPDPDLIIRTSGEQRTSGFMPFQSAYSELYFSDKYFPDFGPAELRKAIEDFSVRKRNFGK